VSKGPIPPPIGFHAWRCPSQHKTTVNRLHILKLRGHRTVGLGGRDDAFVVMRFPQLSLGSS